MHRLALHLFTNSTVSAPSTDLICTTYRSWQERFGTPARVTVWCDPHPNLHWANQYIDRLRQQFDTVNITQSLSDGYVQAVRQSVEPYLFMLEHDWLMLPTIDHDLDTVLSVMEDHGIMHLRFNKRTNKIWKSDKMLQQTEHPQMTYCVTNFISNNPHVINRSLWMSQALPLVNIRDKSFGLEKEVSSAGLKGAIYGALEHPATIRHLDGKNFKGTTWH